MVKLNNIIQKGISVEWTKNDENDEILEIPKGGNANHGRGWYT